MLVSVIIPTYNRAKTIERAVNSALAQTWKHLEVIVVDDGSTDNTDELLEAYGSRIRVIRQKNGGPSAAKNTGIRAATGEIISFLDSDDSWLPPKTERQVNLLQRTESSGVVCCVCNARMLNSTGTVTSFRKAGLYPKHEEGIWSNPADILITTFLLFNQVAAVRREALAQAGYFREDLPYGLNEDYDFALRLALIGPWAFIAEPLMEWHEHTDNISRTYSQLEICATTRKILMDMGTSPRFGPMLPRATLNRRLRYLRNSHYALRLKDHTNPSLRLLGRSLLLCLRKNEGLCSRLFATRRMLTRQA
jgi:glycosyltransferase involved in cell wall biosynthesis